MEKYTKEELQLFIKFLNNQNNLENLNHEELATISMIYKRSKNNDELKKILDELTKEPNNQEILNQYFEVVDLSKGEDDALAQIYDVDISEIEHKFLEDGTEVIKFYCAKLNRNVVFEKQKNGMTLKEQLVRAQDENEQFQTNNASDNTNDILERERVYGNTELKMIPINQLGNYKYLIEKLKPEKITCLEYMMKNADELHLDSINIENVFGMTTKDYGSRIYESYYDKERNKVVIEQPEETINNKEEAVENPKQKFNDEDEIRSAIETMSSEERQKVDMYRNYPELLDALDSQTKEHYQQLIDQIEKDTNQLEKPKVLTLKNNISRSGFVDALILAFIVEFVGFICTTLMILSCR